MGGMLSQIITLFVLFGALNRISFDHLMPYLNHFQKDVAPAVRIFERLSIAIRPLCQRSLDPIPELRKYYTIHEIG